MRDDRQVPSNELVTSTAAHRGGLKRIMQNVQTTGVLGARAFSYRALENWGSIPSEVELGDVAGIAVDEKDQVYLFNRGKHPVVVLDRTGAFRTSWGHGLFTNAHGAHIGPDQCIYLTDNGNHTVRIARS
jgi:hypothetical protein